MNNVKYGIYDPQKRFIDFQQVLQIGMLIQHENPKRLTA